ncbi:MAG: ABC transporter ATP-binding protein, partial [Clostridia bacterium]|nr:ABC transporter ATP-binding protein [Clostridia bacterium]
GKSTLGKAMVNLVDNDALVSGSVKIAGTEIYSINEKELRKLRMHQISICFQNSRELLNPMLSIEEQIYEVLRKKYTQKELAAKTQELLRKVGLSPEVLALYPHQLSGGMVQKVLIATAIALEPKLVILDEPTSSLDPASKGQIINLIQELNELQGITFVVITHDFSVAKALSRRILILYRGKLVEAGSTQDVLRHPRHPYTKGLINSSVEINPYRDVWGIRNIGERDEVIEGCPFYLRCTQSLRECKTVLPALRPYPEDPRRWIACNRGGVITFLRGKDICKSYGCKKIIDKINIEVMAAEVVALVGVSGIGKTTLAGILGGYLEYDSGEIFFLEEKADFNKLHQKKNGLQMVFQDPNSSINPNFTVLEAVAEPLRLTSQEEDYESRVKAVLHDVGLPTGNAFLTQKVRYLSGGQKQRVAIARALTMEPLVLVADEPTSLLDSSSKANLLRLLKGLQNSKGFSMLFITHDLAAAIKIADRIYILEKNNRLKELVDINDFKALEMYFTKAE